MPTYVWRCSSCGHELEHGCQMAERDKTLECPVCHALMIRLIGAPAVVVKDFHGESLKHPGVKNKKIIYQEDISVPRGYGDTLKRERDEAKRKAGV